MNAVWSEQRMAKLANRIDLAVVLNDGALPGSPDLAFWQWVGDDGRLTGLAVYVHGCFWHGHGCARSREPKVNAAFWRNKVLRNKRRDARVRRECRKIGWRTMVVWECLLWKDSDKQMRRLARALGMKP